MGLLSQSAFAFFAAARLRTAWAALGVVAFDKLLQGNSQQTVFSQNDIPDPWSHEPSCFRSTSIATAGKQFCIYTANTTGPTGVSIITTPEAAQTIEELQFLDDNPLDNFLTHQQAQELFTKDPPYEVRKVEGKGLGVFATRKILKYETVMIDQASVVEDMEIEKAFSAQEARTMLAQAVNQLRRPQIVRAMSSDHGGHDSSDTEDDDDDGEGKLETDIMLTNAYGSEVTGRKFRNLFPLISRINHACSPNSYVLFSRAGISMAIKTYRDIEAGEELSVSYLTLGQTFAHRTHALRRWGFTCTCSLCTLPSTAKAESDLRRSLIAQSDSKILEMWNADKYSDAIGLAIEGIQMIKDEGLEHFLTDQYALLAKLWMLAGERKKAEAWARKSWDMLAGMGYLGNEDEQEMWDMETFLERVGSGAMKAVNRVPASLRDGGGSKEGLGVDERLVEVQK
ncbi:SET domain-containing protein [Polyplosphaeria fusca]|uniref:SET domain-containing protein n=1 Tax=Polyplosphaeria fusca TaxID=682080 RepID=A0A9P4UW97_9PLEO|nr:SET domain-containing protein [Polyplosphaeria fusca]